MTPKIKSYAFYLPQFHPIPENDEWWGKGFTEWTNVAKARPLYGGHQQPRLPKDLGFYDLRLPETRAQQAQLARENGIDGFIYYHYWFNGRRLLERPFDEVLNSGKPDFPFALCWANEDWRRNWDGNSGEMLIEQNHSTVDNEAHIEWLMNAFADPRYIRYEGKPLFLIYRAAKIQRIREMLDLWRTRARENGIGELYLCRVESGTDEFEQTPAELGFDAAVEFGTEWRHLGATRVEYGLHVVDYPDTANRMLHRPEAPYKRFAGVMTGFDNAPRNQNGISMEHATPEAYGEWLAATARREIERNPNASEIPIFVNAWNEWAEGAILEPCQIWGSAFLDAHRSAIQDVDSGVVREPKHFAEDRFPSLSVIVQTKGDPEATMACLQAALDATRSERRVEFIVVDNASSDGVRALLTELGDAVTAVRDDAGVTPAAAWRLGINKSHSNRMLLVSTDVRLNAESVDAARQALASMPLASVVSMPMLLDDGRKQATAWVETDESVAAMIDYAELGTRPNTPRVIVTDAPGVRCVKPMARAQ